MRRHERAQIAISVGVASPYLGGITDAWLKNIGGSVVPRLLVCAQVCQQLDASQLHVIM